MQEKWDVRSRNREIVQMPHRWEGANAANMTKRFGRGLALTRTGVGTHQLTAEAGAKAPKLAGCQFQVTGAVACYVHVTAFSEANNTIDIAIFRQATDAAYEMQTTDELWVHCSKADTSTP